MMSIKTYLLGLAASVAAVPLSTPVEHNPRLRSPVGLAPLFEAERAINNSYIVVFKQDAHQSMLDNHFNFLDSANAVDGLLEDLEAGVDKVFNTHFKGYSGRFTDGVVEKIRSQPEVHFVERDQVVTTQDIEVQKAAPWGLARISHREKLSFSTFTKYLFDTQGGEGVDVYVIDTGINVKHTEFAGRASWGKTIPKNDVDDDNNGHGTHCAGTIASNKYGVAKAAHVIAVKVLGSNGSGSMSDVIDGVSFASEAAEAKAKAAEEEFKATGKTSHKGSVANMSLGGGKSRALDTAVNGAVDSGLHFAVAAGNDDKDACNYSPAAAEKAITVGASTLGDERAYFSNKGECVDVFGPGLNILSTYIGSESAIATLSGTSMASPHVAGLTAYLLSIYPSKSFNPQFNEQGDLVSLSTDDQSIFNLSNIYAAAHSILPRWISSMLPSPGLLERATAPLPPKKITPPALKKALLKLSSPDMLSDIPGKTPNLLIFNNATA